MSIEGKEIVQYQPSENQQTADITCFGMITPAVVLVVDEFPEHNTGALVKKSNEFLSDDAVIVACVLRQWGVLSGLITNTLGDDIAGQNAAKQLAALGVRGRVRLLKDIKTPLEVNVSDPTGARTYFWQRDPQVLSTLDKEELSLMVGSRLLYVDWYDGKHILRPMKEARRMNIPIFLNLEYGHQDSDILHQYVRGVSICQVVTDSTQRGGNAVEIAKKVLDAGADTVIVTLEASGCLVITGNQALRVRSHTVHTVDSCGAGATFSAGFAYGYLQGWDIERSARFATAASSLKCSTVGLHAFPVEEINNVAAELATEQIVI